MAASSSRCDPNAAMSDGSGARMRSLNAGKAAIAATSSDDWWPVPSWRCSGELSVEMHIPRYSAMAESRASGDRISRKKKTDLPVLPQSRVSGLNRADASVLNWTVDAVDDGSVK